MLRSASRSAAQQGGPSAEPQPPERQKEALKVMGKPRATNHSGKRGAGCAHSTKDLEQDEEPSSAQQRAARGVPTRLHRVRYLRGEPVSGELIA